MIYLLLSILFWAMWRRVFGGLFHLPRAAIVVVGFLAAAVPFYAIHSPLAALIAGAATGAFWTPGHDFRSNRALMLRYGPVGVPWMLLERFEGRTKLMGWT